MNFFQRILHNPVQKKWLYYGGGAFIFLIVLIIIIVVATSGGQQQFTGRMVLTEVPLVDGHNDLSNNLYLHEKNVLENFKFDSNLKENEKWKDIKTSHTDLPRLKEGRVGAQFWVAYADCESNYLDAIAKTLDQIDVIKRLIATYSNDLVLVTTADGIHAAFNERKIGSLIAIEGGHSIDSRMSVLRLYHELGVRYITLTHDCNTPWADSNKMDEEPVDSHPEKVGGLSAYGEKVVLEMNRLGMMVDISHVSKEVMLGVLKVSKSPVIFSHSSAYGVYKHTRNVQDDVLELLKANKGIIMVNFFSDFIAESDADIKDVIKHLDYIKGKIGADHIGIGADFDGVDKVPKGLEDVSKYPDLFDQLAETNGTHVGWTREELQKLAGLNLVRVFKDVEKVSADMAKTKPYEIVITKEELEKGHAVLTCRTDMKDPTVVPPPEV